MKRILMFAVITVSALVVQASTVSWDYQGMILDKNDGYDSNGVAWVVALGDKTDTSGINVDNSGAISYGDYSLSTQGLILDNMAVANDNYDPMQSIVNDSGNFVLVAAYQEGSSWYYGLSDVISVQVKANDNTDLVTGVLGTSNLSLHTEAVPEPTSVALLALGLAALGLKRKVA